MTSYFLHWNWHVSKTFQHRATHTHTHANIRFQEKNHGNVRQISIKKINNENQFQSIFFLHFHGNGKNDGKNNDITGILQEYGLKRLEKKRDKCIAACINKR